MVGGKGWRKSVGGKRLGAVWCKRMSVKLAEKVGGKVEVRHLISCGLSSLSDKEAIAQ